MSNPPPTPEHPLHARALDARAAGRFEEAAQLLTQAARQGDAASMSLLGVMLMSGLQVRPNPPLGAQLIFDAAGRGDGPACALAANLLASGFNGSRAPDWPGALDHLRRSAEAGHAPAQGQLKVLARQAGAIDLDAWRAPPPARVLSADPAISAVEGFLDPDVCDWVVGRARERLSPANVIGAGGQGPVRDPTRTNTAAEFGLVHTDLVLLLIRDRLSVACGLPVNAMEVTQVFHYAVGQAFRLHEDYLEPDGAYKSRELATHGQRSRTLLVYLNDDFEGGETDFPLIDLKFRGAKGEALIFTNVLPGGAPDQRMRHAGLPPITGEKWLLSQWIRDRNRPGTMG